MANGTKRRLHAALPFAGILSLLLLAACPVGPQDKKLGTLDFGS